MNRQPKRLNRLRRHRRKAGPRCASGDHRSDDEHAAERQCRPTPVRGPGPPALTAGALLIQDNCDTAVFGPTLRGVIGLDRLRRTATVGGELDVAEPVLPGEPILDSLRAALR